MLLVLLIMGTSMMVRILSIGGNVTLGDSNNGVDLTMDRRVGSGSND